MLFVAGGFGGAACVVGWGSSIALVDSLVRRRRRGVDYEYVRLVVDKKLKSCELGDEQHFSPRLLQKMSAWLRTRR